jgi:alkyl sulfatase BDS1-like metallo-beta-lactamase superfamily hydrolase
MDLYYANRGKKPVVAVLFTHSHVDLINTVGDFKQAADINQL